MANPDHLKILQDALNQQDINIWNHWRNQNPSTRPDLNRADLSRADIREADLSGANLQGADFQLADLSNAILTRAEFNGSVIGGRQFAGNIFKNPNLSGANLTGADIREADLSGANLTHANLTGAVLSGSELIRANFARADLSGSELIRADLSNADLRFANLTRAELTGANLKSTLFYNTDMTETIFMDTGFSNVSLSNVSYLDKAIVRGPCTIGIDTLYRSQAVLSEPWFLDFLEQCGVPEPMRTYASSLAVGAFDYYSCFISHSTTDQEFCDQLCSRMKQEGLLVYYAPEDIQGGKKIHEQIYQAILYYDKLILVISEASMNSNWVELEIKRARKREKTENRRVLFPIMLTSFEKIQEWELITSDGEDLAEEIRQYYIPDFGQWKDYDAFTVEFDKLIDALKADDE